MRVRSLVNLATGAAVGAGAMYLFDPEHGRDRRREVRRDAVRRGARSAAQLGRSAVAGLGTVVEAGVNGYQQERERTPTGSGPSMQGARR